MTTVKDVQRAQVLIERCMLEYMPFEEVQTKLNDVLNDLVHALPADPLAWMATISSTVTSDAKRASAERPSFSLTRRR